jgi:hypothetical protein
MRSSCPTDLAKMTPFARSVAEVEEGRRVIGHHRDVQASERRLCTLQTFRDI